MTHNITISSDSLFYSSFIQSKYNKMFSYCAFLEFCDSICESEDIVESTMHKQEFKGFLFFCGTFPRIKWIKSCFCRRIPTHISPPPTETVNYKFFRESSNLIYTNFSFNSMFLNPTLDSHCSKLYFSFSPFVATHDYSFLL